MEVLIDGVLFAPARRPRSEPVKPVWRLMREHRKSLKLTLEQAAKAIGVSISAVSNAEAGPSSLMVTVKLCRLYGIDGNDLVDSLLRSERLQCARVG